MNRFRGNSYMILSRDGSMTMVNFFRPEQGHWELTEKGLLIYDPEFPERGSQVLPVRRRSGRRIVLLLPFADGAVGVGMVRVPEAEAVNTEPSPRPRAARDPRRGGRHQGLSLKDVKVEKLDLSEAFHKEKPDARHTPASLWGDL